MAFLVWDECAHEMLHIVLSGLCKRVGGNIVSSPALLICSVPKALVTITSRRRCANIRILIPI